MRDPFPIESESRDRRAHHFAGAGIRAASSGNVGGIAPDLGWIRPTAVAVAVCALFATVGCGYTGDAEVEEETVQAPPPPAPAAADAAEPPARSAYGKAMEAAHRLEDKVDAYNKKLEKAADDVFE
ncbi:MAG: hypothetical protein LW806_02120 [Planctomycetaceae bacterium]|nr:hypothetical protein [Planctomycetaceae bacterium]